jgi:Fe-S cluster assembly iron-binding protein IscA
MLHLSPTAVAVINELRRAEGVPDSHGIRLDGLPSPEGAVQIRLAFQESPAPKDVVGEAEGTKIFVAENLAAPLENALIDAGTDGQGGPLVLKLDRDG